MAARVLETQLSVMRNSPHSLVCSPRHLGPEDQLPSLHTQPLRRAALAVPVHNHHCAGTSEVRVHVCVHGQEADRPNGDAGGKTW